MRKLLRYFHSLSIKTKFCIIFILEGILITAFALLTFYNLLLVKIDEISKTAMENEYLILQSRLDEEKSALLGNARDYAYWDDVYNYVNNRDEEWAKENITEWVPKNFNIDLVLIFDASNRLIYKYGDFGEFVKDKDLSNHPLVSLISTTAEVNGFYSTSKGITLIASSQILHTDESGPRNGTYLYGKIVNLNTLKTVLGPQLNLSLIGIKGDVLNSTLAEHVYYIKGHKEILNELINENVSSFKIYCHPKEEFCYIYSLVKDIAGEDIGMFEMIREMSLNSAFKDSMKKVSKMIFSIVVVLVFFSVLLGTRIILKSLDNLQKTITDILKTKDKSKRVKVLALDEVGIISLNFNALMEQLKTTEEQLLETQKNLIKTESIKAASELSLGAVHQLNNPLSIALARVEMLRRFMDYDVRLTAGDLEKDLNVIDNQIKRAINTVNQLLRYAKPAQPRFKSCNINDLLSEVLTLVEDSLKANKIKLVKNFEENLPTIQHCDSKLISEVFINIIKNAKEAMLDGGILEIDTYFNKKDAVFITFKDNAAGIPPEILDRLFIPFFSTKADKAGLGLSVAYNIIKQHKGTIEVESKTGFGSKFIIKLPVT